jgi:ketosteroid isomerase-like protein
MRFQTLAIVAIAFGATVVSAQDSDEQQIRRSRAYSNASIARHDTLGVGAAMANDIVVITSRSTKTSGRSNYLITFEDQFRSRPDVVYVRTPDQVRVFAPWGMASEHGTWTGSWTDSDGKIEIGGTYFAKWRKVDGRWLIESETYVPERCAGGAYCRTVPPE